MPLAKLHRIIIAGLAGDVGKSLVSLGAIGALRARGLAVAPFKKGPDFIDAAWLGAAAGAGPSELDEARFLQAGRNLDTFMMPRERILASMAGAAQSSDIAIVEGNRGLFDGLDAHGSHSTAELAKLIRAPLVLVVDATKVTRTVAAYVMGCRALDPELQLAGVVLNRVGTARQEALIREAVTGATGIPVLGAIPRLDEQHLPSRHLGLVTALEHSGASEVLEKLAGIIERHVDLDQLLELASQAPDLEPGALPEPVGESAPRVRVGVLRDRAFSFYYPENLSELERAGAELVFISPLSDRELPAIDALYAGGGFPEVHAAELSANTALRSALRERIESGLPVWAECGGLMYLSRALRAEGETHPMVGALPVEVEQMRRPQGHGYVQGAVDGANPFLEHGLAFRGHEFHYSRLVAGLENAGEVPTVMALERGVGVGGGRDGMRVRNVVASYTHLHALGAPQWARGLVAAAAGGAR